MSAIKFPNVKRAQKGPKARKRRRVYSNVLFVMVTVIVLTNVCLSGGDDAFGCTFQKRRRQYGYYYYALSLSLPKRSFSNMAAKLILGFSASAASAATEYWTPFFCVSSKSGGRLVVVVFVSSL